MKLKRAFSLIEVLLVMGIIAVVTAMGFSISKTSMEKAHNLFWYTGYETLYKVTIDAVQRLDQNGNPVFDPDNPRIEDYANHLAKMIGAQEPTSCPVNPESETNACLLVQAPNGINYEIFSKLNSSSELYKIDMTIPALRQRRVYLNKTRFIYMFKNDDGYIEGMVYPSQLNNTLEGQGYANLHNRVDLLTFYLSDATDNPTASRTFYGFRDAYCTANYKSPVGNPGEEGYDPGYNGYQSGAWDDASVDCRSGYTQTDLLGFSVYPISPRKAF